jgi:hypothetical protein
LRDDEDLRPDDLDLVAIGAPGGRVRGTQRKIRALRLSRAGPTPGRTSPTRRRSARPVARRTGSSILPGGVGRGLARHRRPPSRTRAGSPPTPRARTRGASPAASGRLTGRPGAGAWGVAHVIAVESLVSARDPRVGADRRETRRGVTPPVIALPKDRPSRGRATPRAGAFTAAADEIDTRRCDVDLIASLC